MKRRIAILGCGGMAQAHATAIRTYGGLDLVAGADPSAVSRDAFKKLAPGARLYEDSLKLLETEKPDFVVVASPLMFHSELTLAALNAGAHVMCEKPLAMTLEQADRMIGTAKSLRRSLLVDHQFRTHPRAAAALKLVRGGAIGEIVSMHGTGKGKNFAGFEILEHGSHVFDMAILFGGKPRWASSMIAADNRPATAADIIESRNVARLNSGPVVGDRVHATVGFDKESVFHVEFLDIPKNLAVQVIGTRGAVYVPLGAGAEASFIRQQSYANPNDPAAGWERIPFELGKWAQDMNAPTYDTWVQWVDSGGDHPMAIDGRHPMDAENGRLALEIAHGIFESHFREGARIPLPMEKREHPLARRAAAAK